MDAYFEAFYYATSEAINWSRFAVEPDRITSATRQSLHPFCVSVVPLLFAVGLANFKINLFLFIAMGFFHDKVYIMTSAS
jgi:hypothetical protein